MRNSEQKGCTARVTQTFSYIWNWSTGQVATGLSSGFSAGYFTGALLKRFMDGIPAFSLGTGLGLLVGFFSVYGVEKENLEHIQQVTKQIEDIQKALLESLTQYSFYFGKMGMVAEQQLRDSFLRKRNQYLEDTFLRYSEDNKSEPKKSSHTRLSNPRSSSIIPKTTSTSPLTGNLQTLPTDRSQEFINKIVLKNLEDKKEEQEKFFIKFCKILKNSNKLTRAITVYYALTIGYYIDYSLEEIAKVSTEIALPTAVTMTVFIAPILTYVCSAPSRTKLTQKQKRFEYLQRLYEEIKSEADFQKSNFENFSMVIRSVEEEKNLNHKIFIGDGSAKHLHGIFKEENEKKIVKITGIGNNQSTRIDQVTITTPLLMSTIDSINF